MTAPTLDDELYRSTVCRMMESHGARLFGLTLTLAASLRHAPTASWLRFAGGQLRELTSLYAELSSLYEAVAGAALDPPSLGRDGAREPGAPASWPDAVAALLVAGRQCRWQLHEHDLCSYAPYRELVARAVAELDARHAALEPHLALAARDPRAAHALTEALDRWMAWAAEAFGRPNTPGMAYAIKVGLRRRDASATRGDFVDDLRAVARAHDLELPARWRPEPERPSVLEALSEIARTARDPE